MELVLRGGEGEEQDWVDIVCNSTVASPFLFHQPTPK